MFGETTISYVKIGNHPIETTIYKWLALGFQVRVPVSEPGDSSRDLFDSPVGGHQLAFKGSRDLHHSQQGHDCRIARNMNVLSQPQDF